MKKLWFGIAISLLAVTTSSAAQRNRGTDNARSHTSVTGFASAPGERSPGVFDRKQHHFAQQLLFDRLYAERVDTAIDEPIVVNVTAKELAQLDAIDPNDRRVRVGLVKPIDLDVTFVDPTGVGKSTTLPVGALRPMTDGYVWTLAITAPGATGLRVHLTDMNLSGTTALYIYTPDGEAFGPYTAPTDGDLWTNTVMGDVAVLQLRTNGPSAASDLASTSFRVADLGFLGDKFFLGKMAAKSKSFCGFNEPCIDNAECYGTSDWSEIDSTQNGVAHMQWVSGPFLYMCSGGLLADTVTTSQIPYFLTANHCISRGKDARNLECFWQFDTPCGGNCYDPRGNVPRTLGASIKSTNRTGDYTLMELDEAPPAGSHFLGWTSAAVANSDGTALHRISHPSGAPQAYSSQDVDTSRPTCTSWPRGSWIYSSDTVGGTEGGSSGSPILNAAGEVVGQLSGACGFNTGDPCDTFSNATVDGALASYFSEVEQFLDPSTGCTPAAEVCDDGVDNDCDGATDCNDSDCDGDPACDTSSCGGNKDSCNVNADCCSNNCRNGQCKGN